MSFTHLHLHSCYSSQYSIAKINDIVDRVKELGQTSVAITDAGVLSGAIDFFETCLRKGIMPIIGMELSLIDDISVANHKEDKYNNIVLLCENEIGYRNLIKLYSAGTKNYNRLVIDYSLLNKYKEGLICLSSVSKESVVPINERGNNDEIKEYYLKLNKIFGSDNLFIEIQNHKLSFEHDINQELIKIGKEIGLKLVATNDCHYVMKEDSLAQDVYRCQETCMDYSDESDLKYETAQYYITSENEMKDLFSFYPDAVYNTKIIADRCKVKIEFVEPYYTQLINSIDNNMDLNDKEELKIMVKKCDYKIPFFDLPYGYTNIEYLTKLAMEGLQSKYDLENSNEIIERLNYELSLIDKNGFTDYFLIIADYVNYSKTNGISIGIGCGSSVSSLLCYALSITDVNPCKYNLFFERFINGENVIIPNIWIEISGDERYKVMEYLNKKYGDLSVIYIPSFGKIEYMRGIRGIRIISDILRVPKEKIDTLLQLLAVNNTYKYTLLDLLKLNLDSLPNKNFIENFRHLYNNDDEIKKIVDVAIRIDGLKYRKLIEPRDTIITISNTNNCILPTHKEYVERANETGRCSEGEVCCFDINTIEKLGYAQFTFIENKYLDFIKLLINRIKDKKGISIDINNISLNDENVYQMLSYGDIGDILNIAYIGSQQGIDFTKSFKPNKFEDLIIEYAVFIPKLNKNLDELLKRKNNIELIDNIDLTYDSILSETYGLIIYQEQIMEILNKLAGYSLINAEKTRRAMAKKKYSEIEKERHRFIYGDKELTINGCIKNGISEDVGNLIFDHMIESAAYAFNKSHAVATSKLIYISAYLKCYYKNEFIKCHNDYFRNSVQDVLGRI